MQQGDKMSTCYIFIFVFVNSEPLQFSKKKKKKVYLQTQIDMYLTSESLLYEIPFYSHSISPYFLVETVFWGYR